MQPTTYEQDFQSWIAQTIEHLRKGEFKSLDLGNLIEDLTDLGKSEKNTSKAT